MVHPVAYEHAPEDHNVFHIATAEYGTDRLDEITPMAGGVLDGVPSELLSHSLKGEDPPTGIYVTPAHPTGPDIDAALLFLDAIEPVYDFAVDRSKLGDQDTLRDASGADGNSRRVKTARAERESYADRTYM